MKAKLQQGDCVQYLANGRKLRGVVQDVLPGFNRDSVPVLKRKKTVWIDRATLRKLPAKRN